MDTDSSAAKTESVPLAASGNPLQPNYATENAAAAPQTLKNSSYGKNADVVGIIAIVLVAVLIIFVIGMVIYLATSSDDLSPIPTGNLTTTRKPGNITTTKPSVTTTTTRKPGSSSVAISITVNINGTKVNGTSSNAPSVMRSAGSFLPICLSIIVALAL